MLLFLNLLKVITYSLEITNFMPIWIGVQGVSPGKQKPSKYVKYCCTLYLECLPKSMCLRIGTQSSAIVWVTECLTEDLRWSSWVFGNMPTGGYGTLAFHVVCALWFMVYALLWCTASLEPPSNRLPMDLKLYILGAKINLLYTFTILGILL